MRRLILAGLVVAAIAPNVAFAWSVQSAPSSQDSSKFTDQDDRLQHMTGRDEYGNSTNSSGTGVSFGGLTLSGSSQEPNSAPPLPVYTGPSLLVGPRH
jgi:hypothetical protein